MRYNTGRSAVDVTVLDVGAIPEDKCHGPAVMATSCGWKSAASKFIMTTNSSGNVACHRSNKEYTDSLCSSATADDSVSLAGCPCSWCNGLSGGYNGPGYTV